MWGCLPWFMVSCGIYRQNTIPVPLFTGAGQASLSAHANFNGPEAQLAISPVTGIGVLAGYQDLGVQTIRYSQDNYETTSHRFLEGGIGMYFPAGKSYGQLIREVYLLGGTGRTNHYVQGYNNGILEKTKTIGQYERYALQANFGWQMPDIGFAISPRLSVIHYRDCERTGTTPLRVTSRFQTCAETGISCKVKLVNHLNAIGQMCVSFPVDEVTSADFDFSPISLSLGLMVDMRVFGGKPVSPGPPDGP